jgi:hypothetical protein
MSKIRFPNLSFLTSNHKLKTLFLIQRNFRSYFFSFSSLQILFILRAFSYQNPIRFGFNSTRIHHGLEGVSFSVKMDLLFQLIHDYRTKTFIPEVFITKFFPQRNQSVKLGANQTKFFPIPKLSENLIASCQLALAKYSL